MTKRFLPLWILILAPFAQASMPQDWYTLPEERAGAEQPKTAPQPAGRSDSQGLLPDPSSDQDALATQVREIFSASGAALDSLPELSRAPTDASGKPKDWVPWHLEAFTTDLGLTAQGLLGALTVKGSPAVSAFWRRKAAPSLESALSDDGMESGQGSGSDPGPDSGLAAEIEPAVRALLSTGRIRDERAFRRNILRTAEGLQGWIESVSRRKSSPWWISGFRFDLAVDASGKISPLSTVGADLRFRFEWKRLQRQRSSMAGADAKVQPLAFGSGSDQRQMETFIDGLVADLEAASEDFAAKDSAYRPSAFRVGIGMSVGGKIGISKTQASALGHVTFSRDMSAPKPAPAELLGPETSDLLLVDQDPRQETIDFAVKQGISLAGVFRDDSGKAVEALYRIDRNKFRGGLAKAFRIGRFFARQSGSGDSKSWQLFQVKTGFDLSITGALGVLKLGSLGAAEITFMNTKF